jgi:hypothetical protein
VDQVMLLLIPPVVRHVCCIYGYPAIRAHTGNFQGRDNDFEILWLYVKI